VIFVRDPKPDSYKQVAGATLSIQCRFQMDLFLTREQPI
jgi:hypothetical protein